MIFADLSVYYDFLEILIYQHYYFFKNNPENFMKLYGVGSISISKVRQLIRHTCCDKFLENHDVRL